MNIYTKMSRHLTAHFHNLFVPTSISLPKYKGASGKLNFTKLLFYSNYLVVSGILHIFVPLIHSLIYSTFASMRKWNIMWLTADSTSADCQTCSLRQEERTYLSGLQNVSLGASERISRAFGTYLSLTCLCKGAAFRQAAFPLNSS